MKIYLELVKKPVFTLEDVKRLCCNTGTAKNHIAKLVKAGYVKRIRTNLYSCINLETGEIVANKYQIASAITETSFVSHHSAMEYYGVADQVYYDVYVSSILPFRNFVYDGYAFKCVVTKNTSNIVSPAMSRGIRISSIERTIVDSLKDMNKIAGLEEVISNIELLPLVKEGNLVDVLSEYDNQFLYQKVGMILEIFKGQFGLSDSFFSLCKSKMGKSKRYLTTDLNCSTWNSQWQLMVPTGILQMKNGRDNIDEF